MELSMAALLAAAFAYRNIISLVCIGFVAIGMASAPQTCARLWRVLVRSCTARIHPSHVDDVACLQQQDHHGAICAGSLLKVLNIAGYSAL